MSIREIQKKKNKIRLLKKDSNVLVDELERTTDAILSMKRKFNKLDKISMIKGEKGDKGDMPVAGIDYPIPQNGKDADEDRIIDIVMNKIRIPRDGELGIPGKPGKDAKPVDIKKVIKSVLTQIPKPDGLDEDKIIKQLIEKIPEPESGRPPKHEVAGKSIRFENPDGSWGEWIHLGEMLGGKTLHRGGVSIETEDLTDQCNSVTKTFTTEFPMLKVISLSSTQFPIIYRRTIDYTFSGNTITLTDEVGSPKTGQTLDIAYIRA